MQSKTLGMPLYAREQPEGFDWGRNRNTEHRNIEHRNIEHRNIEHQNTEHQNTRTTKT